MKTVPPRDETASYLFHQGTNFAAYKYLGAHKLDSGYVFRTFAPKAKAVSVCGDFNYWNKTQYPMQRITDGGIWEGFIEGLLEFSSYKYAITAQDGRVIDKADPYAFHAQTRPNTASRLYDMDKDFKWSDKKWIAKRTKTDIYSSPVNIYELNAASWKKHFDGNFYSYDAIAEHLIPYIKEMGYTHVQFMPLTEYPLDMSWGYQVSGYFAATSRFGAPDGLMRLINSLHNADIGVIMDWVPAHFPKDEFGLARFDGDYCYEYESNSKRENPDWGTFQFDYGKPEVQSFLVSNASFWFDKYHIDGLRVDAVAAMLYLNYSRKDGEWQANGFGGYQNLEAISLFRKLNGHVFGVFPGIMMIAEESTSWPNITKPVHEGGLGFNYKWNMGWMNDSLKYFETPTIYRKYHHSVITNTLLWAFSENYILPISHDEVVHLKASLINKMPGDYWQKFANVRLFQCYALCYPGKKLMFMGSEFGQFNEWNDEKELEWGHLEYEPHQQLQSFFAASNKFYLEQKPFYEDDSPSGFYWICYDDSYNQILSFVRKDKSGNEIIVLLNMSPTVHYDYHIGVSKPGKYVEVFNSDELCYYGSGVKNGVLTTKDAPMHGHMQSLSVTVPPLSGLFLKWKK